MLAAIAGKQSNWYDIPSAFKYMGFGNHIIKILVRKLKNIYYKNHNFFL